MSGYLFLGGTGDSPDGTETTLRTNQRGLPAKLLSTLPVGKLPTGAGESPAPPIFQARSQGETIKEERGWMYERVVGVSRPGCMTEYFSRLVKQGFPGDLWLSINRGPLSR
jgi:hypothetical protein